MSAPIKVPDLVKVDPRGDFQVWIVDSPNVRGHIHEEFTHFGQHHRCLCIPDLEFCIDDILAAESRA